MDFLEDWLEFLVLGTIGPISSTTLWMAISSLNTSYLGNFSYLKLGKTSQIKSTILHMAALMLNTS